MRFADGFGRSRNSATDQGACRHRDELHAHGPSEEVAQVQGCDRQGAPEYGHHQVKMAPAVLLLCMSRKSE